MKWTVHQLRAAKHRGFSFDEVLNLDSLKEQNRDIRAVSSVHVKGEAVFSGDMITFPLHIKGSLTLPCSRTLADVSFPFDLHVSEQFRVNDTTPVSMEDEDIHPVVGDVIDLTPYIKERILLEIPMQIFSDDDENGQAPPEGKGWELISEEDKQDRIDPRLAELAKFFDKN
ncbi:YceD family protein [Halalkalibacterium ligniniphilum]|uniref:YceD family protein n=1 Tax=Halalkalibacterium ligniniphilum TaxID=1134413 RepID=UPI00034C3A38|nr:DUF177 domain-containing protein [Halalkalibacterium ligniniphilum]